MAAPIDSFWYLVWRELDDDVLISMNDYPCCNLGEFYES